jgi:ATP-dependent Clp protease ATP-binding subunit ClpA
MVIPSSQLEANEVYHQATRAGRQSAVRPTAEGDAMAGWYLSEQAREALRTARSLARGRWAEGSADPLLVAILGTWSDERAGGPALLRACGLTADQAGQLAATLVPAANDAEAATPGAEPRVIGSLRFVLDQAYRIAAEAHAPYVGTEHLVAAMLWDDSYTGAHELRRHGVSYARAAEQLATLRHTERAEQIDPLEVVEAPTPAAARLHELARQQAGQHPIQGDGRISTLHHLLALLMLRTAASELLGELGVRHEEVVRRIAEAGAPLVEADDWRPEEHPLEGWEQFEVTPEQREVIGRRVGDVIAGPLWERGVRFGGADTWVMIHPGRSGLAAREILDRILGTS